MRTDATPRRGLNLLVTVALLIALPLFELWLLIKVGEQIGVLPTIGIILAEAVLGGWLMKREGRHAWRALNVSVAEGRAPSRELADAALILIGGVLLIIPGFLTDLLGLICLIPFTRPLARLVLGLILARRLGRGLTPNGLTASRLDDGYRGSYGADADGLIEGEVVQDPAPVVIRGEVKGR